jgi:CHAT domain-containing protein
VASIIELEVAAGAAAGQFAVRVVRSASGGNSTATMQLDAQQYLNGRDDLETVVLASAATSRRIFSPGEQRLRDVGQQLFEALFSGPVNEAYRASASTADAGNERLQVVLRLNAPELAGIPWEAMYDPRDEEFICRAENPLVRHIPSAAVEPLEVASSLEVLVLVASPTDLPALDVETERRKLTDALAEPIADGRIHLKWLMQASWDDVQDEMLSGTWHALHFIGHGDYDPSSDQGVIALVGDEGRAHYVEADRLAELLNQATPTPRLVVLNSCQSGRSSAQNLFSSTAATLVRRGISAVAAMQFAISDTGAIKFSRGFYSALASGRAIGDAIGAGRVGLLGTPGSLEWVTPVLYVRDDNASLFKITGPPEPAPLPAPPTPAPPPALPPRKRLSNKALAAIGGVAAAVLAVVAIVMASVIPSGPDRDTRVAPPPPPPTTTTSHDIETPLSVDAWIDRLGLHGVDYSQPKSVLVSYLNNSEYTSYPALADALLQLLAGNAVRRPVDIFAVVWNYENAPNNPVPEPRRAEDVDLEVLKAAVLENFNNRYGEEAPDFESVLKPIGSPG